jgi:hypothetical protein
MAAFKLKPESCIKRTFLVFIFFVEDPVAQSFTFRAEVKEIRVEHADETAKEWGLAKLTPLLSHCQYPLHLFCVAPCLHFGRVNLHQCPLSCETWSLQNGAVCMLFALWQFNIAVENQTYDIPALSIIEL